LKLPLLLRDSTILFVDPGIQCTGLAVVKTPGLNCPQRVLAAHRKWRSDETAGTQKRIQSIWECALGFVRFHNVNQVVIEEPPETVYKQKGRGVDYGIGRATSLFKTYAITHSVLAAILAAEPRVKGYTILPVQWQPHYKRRDGLSTKEWSLRHANVVLQKQGIHELLHTSDDENIADAISMGWILTQE
jgi:hypothetical protein